MKFTFAHNNINVLNLEKSIRNPEMGIYFIADPDGYWTEIIPAKE